MQRDGCSGDPTTRVALRELRADDDAALGEVLADPRVMRYWSHAPLRTPDEIRWYLRDAECGRRDATHFRWAITQVIDDRLIGIASLHGFSADRRRAAISYALAHAAQGRGFAREAVGALVALAFDAFGLETIEARVDRANLRSRALLARLGFSACAECDDDGHFARRR